jgi:hypothetical protein
VKPRTLYEALEELRYRCRQLGRQLATDPVVTGIMDWLARLLKGRR